MKSLLFIPVVYANDRVAVEPTPIHEQPGLNACCALQLQDNGRLTTACLERGGDAPRTAGDAILLALGRRCRGSRESAWVIVPRANNITLNNHAPLSAAVIEPGMLLAVGDRCWFISSLWQPEPGETPAELRDKPCPVCGGELGLARVVQCSCGRWMHLENAAAPHDQEALNCFIAAGTCGGCGRRATLEPQIVPEVPDRLASAPIGEDEFGWPSGDGHDHA